MIKNLIFFFTCFTFVLNAFDEVPLKSLQGHVGRIITEWQNLEKSSIACKEEAKSALEKFTASYEAALVSKDFKKVCDLLECIDKEINNERSLKFWFASNAGYAQNWPIPYYECAGHEEEKVFSSHEDAMAFGLKKREELHRQSDILRVTKHVHVEDLKLRENIKNLVSMLGAVTLGLTVLNFGYKKALEASLFSDSSGGSLNNIALAGVACGAVSFAGRVLNQSFKLYFQTTYKVTWGYTHNEDHLTRCTFKRKLETVRSTQRMLDLLDTFSSNLRLILATQRVDSVTKKHT